MKTLKFICLTILMSLFGALAPAQYNELVWNTFDSPALPANLRLGHFSKTENVYGVAYSQAPAMPGLTGGRAEQENGIGGILFRPSNTHRHLSLLDKRTLVRDQLLQQGRALFQADFYLPAPGTPIPSMAMIASEHKEGAEGDSYFFYRFGVQKDSLFFAFANGKGTPDFVHKQPISQLGLSRPGWHRFQIIFLGPEEIYCAVDGKFTSFSPIKESTLRRLNVGIMMTTDEDLEWVGEKLGLADNLSIQWTAYEAPLPVSPWAEGAVAVAGRTSSVGRKRQLMEVGSAVNWTGDSGAAWAQATKQNRPVLALFYVPNIPPYKYLVDVCPNDEAAQKFLEQYILLRIDINQLGGGRAARAFDVTRTPTLVVVGPDGKERSRMTVIKDHTKWNDIVAGLQTSAVNGAQISQSR